MVRRRASEAQDEMLLAFEFPERPGALLQFLRRSGTLERRPFSTTGTRLRVSGRVLCGLEVPPDARAELRRRSTPSVSTTPRLGRHGRAGWVPRAPTARAHDRRAGARGGERAYAGQLVAYFLPSGRSASVPRSPWSATCQAAWSSAGAGSRARLLEGLALAQMAPDRSRPSSRSTSAGCARGTTVATLVAWPSSCPRS